MRGATSRPKKASATPANGAGLRVQGGVSEAEAWGEDGMIRVLAIG